MIEEPVHDAMAIARGPAEPFGDPSSEVFPHRQDGLRRACRLGAYLSYALEEIGEPLLPRAAIANRLEPVVVARPVSLEKCER